MDSEILQLSVRAGVLLSAQRKMLASAESCTGGWLAKALTDVPGSSRWFERGFVTYSNAAKTELLGVDESLLMREGAVSEATVKAMARGALAHSRAQFAVAISGVAGPDGGTPEKPVGVVWLAWMMNEPSALVTRRLHLEGDRDAVRRAAVIAALEGIIEIVENSEAGNE